MWWIIIIAIILILFIIGFIAKYRHYLEDKADKSKIYHAIKFEKGTPLSEVKEKLGSNYETVSRSGILLRIRFKISEEDIKNYKRRLYKNSKFIQMDFDSKNLLLKVNVI